ncbi:MAG: hypothetical protein CMLOHMNK_00343 [Steroidobacteraceae bacterium]|nr:hypothetical protein [Steroidobacteraceae bacterium]
MTQHFPAPFDLGTKITTRSISFENPAGARGAGGRAASPLGPGRKGSAVRHVHPGETIELANIEGPGTIRHIWATTHSKPEMLRGCLIRIYWDDSPHPGVEAPLGDFFGFAHGRTGAFQSCAHSVGAALGMNIWLPMPFVRRARVELCNEAPMRLPFFYQIDYTLGDPHPDDVGRLHVLFRRENPTTRGRDFELLPLRHGRIRFLGSVIGVRPLDPRWWGEGEMKAWIDDDDRLATIVGTGTEDYVGLSWGIQANAFLYHGANWRENDDATKTGAVSIYRWHLPDPLLCERRMRVAIQQIGHSPTGNARSIADYMAELYEREDDWSCASFWYQATPGEPLPAIPDAATRIRDLPAAPES